MRIEKGLELAGYFWLPNHSGQKVPGTLRIADGGIIELEVLGTFDLSPGQLTTEMQVPRIIGEIEREGMVTLEKCLYKKKQVAFGSIPKSILRVHKAITGVQLEGDSALTVTEFNFSVEGLDEWLGISGLEVKHDFANNSAAISYSPPRETVFRLSSGIGITFTYSWELQGIGTLTNASISQRAFVRLSSEEPIAVEKFIAVAHKLVKFFCFAVDDTVSIRRVSMRSPEVVYEIPGGEPILVEMSCFYPSLAYSKIVPRIDAERMLFRFNEIESETGLILNRWFDTFEVIGPALNLYFSAKAGDHKYHDGRFLSLAQCLESYHRRTSDEKVMDDDKYSEIVALMIGVCPKNYQEMMSNKLSYGNELTLKTRMERLIEPFVVYFGDKGRTSRIIRLIVDTRNYLTHFNKGLEKRAASGIELWSLCMKMEALFELHLLREFGFSMARIAEVDRERGHFQQKLSDA